MLKTVTRMSAPDTKEKPVGPPQGLVILGWYLLFKVAIVIASVLVIKWYPRGLAPLFSRAWWDVLGSTGLLTLLMAALIPIKLRRDGLSVSDLGYDPRWRPRHLAWGVGAGAVIWFIHHALLGWASRAAGPGWINVGMESGATAYRLGGPAAEFGAWFCAVVLSPILEETVYRAGLISSLRNRWGGGAGREAGYVLASGLLFALGHYLSHPLYSAVYAVTGASLALLYVKTRSLNTVIVAHAMINAIVQFRAFGH